MLVALAWMYHQNIWQTNLLCPGGGNYQWNQKFKTYQTSAFGHPGEPRTPENLSVIGKWKTVDLGLNFENDGLRAKVGLSKEKKKLD